MDTRGTRTRVLAVRLAGLAVLSLLIFGCGSPRDKVAGKLAGQVTHHGGKPLTNAWISFHSPQEGTHGSAAIGADGKYRLEGVLKAGSYQVRVTPPPVVDPADGSPPPKPIENPDIPEKYREFNTSGLSVTVEPGENQFNVELKE